MARERKEASEPNLESIARYTKRLLWPTPANDNQIPLATWVRWIGVWGIIASTGIALYLFV